MRAVNRVDQRISEAEKLGFKEIYISKYNKKGLDVSRFKMKIHFVAKLEEVFEGILSSG